MTEVRSVDRKGRSSTRRSLFWSLGFYGLCAASVAGACLYFFLAYVPGRRAAAVKEWRQELTLRASLREMTLDRWIESGLANAEFLASYAAPLAVVARGAKPASTGHDESTSTHLRKLMDGFTRIGGYNGFALLDADMHVVVESGAVHHVEPPILRVAAAVLARGASAVDFHRHTDGTVAVAFLARLKTDTEPRTGGGVVLLETDPSHWLYPYLAMRPMAASSAETLLMRREDDDIVFLSPLRHNPAPPLTFRRPANLAGFAALAAVEGRGEFGEYVDYRNEPVFAATHRLGHVPWGLVVKIDRREALADYRREVRQTGATAAAAILAFWAVAFMLVLTWRRRSEATLREGEERYRATLYSIGDAVIATDHGGLVKQMNPVAERLTDWTQSDARGKHLDEVFRIINEETRAVVESPVAHVLREGQVVGLANHTLLIGKDGIEHPIADSGAPILDEKGEVTGVVLVFRDQTEERAAQRALRESERRYRTLAVSLPHLVWTCRADGPCDYLSPRWIEYTGIPEAGQLGYGWLEQLHPDDRERVIAEWGEVAPRGGVFDIEFRIRRADGAYRWFKTRAIPFRDNDGRLVKWFGSNTDIDDEKRAHEALRESEKALIEAQRVARVGNWEWDVVSDAITASKEFYRLFDVEPEQLARYQQFVECLHPDDRERVGAEVNEALRQKRTYDTDYRVRQRDGRWRDIHARGKLFTDAGGKPVRLAGTCLDITERKRAEESVRESEARHRATLYSIGDAVIATDAKSRINRMNPVAERLTGWTEAEAEGKPLDEVFRIVNEETRAVVESPVARVLREGQVVGLANHTLLVAKDGTERPIADSGAPIRDNKDETTGVVLVFRDQTEERRAGDALRRSEAILRAVIEGTTNLVCVKDPQGRIIIANSAMTRFIGKPESEIIGKSDLELVADAEQAAEIVKNDRRIMATGGSETVEETGHGVAGRWDYLFTKSPYHDLDGHVVGLIGIGTDITERKRAEDEVRRLNAELEQRVRDRTAQLEESNKELEAFSYSVSHDLRAPLRAIDGFTRILTGDYGPRLDMEGQRICSVIHDNTQKMGQLIDDLLSFSRLGRAEMSLSRIDMETMADSVFHELTTPESRARIDFQVGALPPAVVDPTLMRQAWMNLLSNAIKFSSKRQRAVIKVSAQQSQGEDIYAIQDDGAGFDMQYVGKLFGVFQRLHSSKEFEGTGVGLALVQRVIQRHGGRVWAKGEPDRGATFYFAFQQKGA